jgi:hypothetical protein
VLIRSDHLEEGNCTERVGIRVLTLLVNSMIQPEREALRTALVTELDEAYDGFRPVIDRIKVSSSSVLNEFNHSQRMFTVFHISLG